MNAFRRALDKVFFWFHDTALVKQLIVEQQYFTYLQTPRAQDPKRLISAGYTVFSQSDEDGILAEIFRRIGVTSKTAVEFGLQHGLESNTLLLAVDGWKTWWFEGDETYTGQLTEKFSPSVCPNLHVKQAFITRQNINAVFKSAKVPKEIDVLCIDIDSCDYWVWKGLTYTKPRVVIIEYNAEWGPHVAWTIPESTDFQWEGDSHYGASLKALEKLGVEKGYTLVGCSYSGVNAFFVRSDLVKKKFAVPATSENHWEPPREKFIFKPGKKRTIQSVMKVK